MNYVMDRPLLEVIACEMHCEYLSDLRFLRAFSRKRVASLIDKSIPAMNASLREWNDALAYLVDETAEKTQTAARLKLIRCLEEGAA